MGISEKQKDTCCDARLPENESYELWWNSEQLLKTLTPVAGVLLVAGFLGSIGDGLKGWSTFFYALSILAGSPFVVRDAIIGLFKKRFLNISFLVVIASVGALYIGEYGEAAAVLFLFSLAELFESYGVERSRRAVTALLERSPKVARLQDGTTVSVDSVTVGTEIVVRPGEQVPLDGTVTKGSSTVDEAPITGESVPADKQVGSTVFAGTMNIQGYLEIIVTKKSTDSVFSRIVTLIQEAQASRAPTEAFIDRFAKYYTPLIVVLAVLIAIVPSLVFGESFDIWLYRALVLLVIACPCALVISTPVAIASAIGGASRSGILIKGGTYLEKLAGVKAIAFDKTRTLTYGRHSVTDVLAFGSHTKEEVIADAAGIEAFSSHPLAEAIFVYAKAHNVTPHVMESYENVTGKGGRARCVVCNAHHYVGNQKLMQTFGVKDAAFTADIERLEKEGKTVVLIAENTELIGVLAISDVVREEAKIVMGDLKKLGVENIMLTGDNAHSASHIAGLAGISEIQASLSPEDKVTHIKELQKRFDRVAMVGDGVNDAPALTTSDVGFAIGAGGTDVAIESADIALLSGDLTTIPKAIRLARKTMKIVRSNIVLALGIKVLFLMLVANGHSNLVFAIAADSGMALVVIVNSLRLFTLR